MLTLGPLAFTAPWMLLGMAALPLLWWLLRLLPPVPRPIPFPAIRLLFGLRSEETTPQAAPWWLTLLRLAIAALVIAVVARPVLNPDTVLDGGGPLILAIDDDWAAASQWQQRLDRAEALLESAARADRAVYLILGAAPVSGEPLEAGRLVSAPKAQEIVAALVPKPWPIDREAMTRAAADLATQDVSGDIFWFSNGLETEDVGAFVDTLAALGPLTVLTADLSQGPMLIMPPSPVDAAMTLSLRRLTGDGTLPVAVVGYAEDGRPLIQRDSVFQDGDVETTVDIDVPIELRNELSRLVLEGRSGVGGTVILDSRWSRRPMGIIAAVGNREALPLLSETYFLDRALQPLGAVDRAPVSILLKQPQSILLLPDEAVLEQEDTETLTRWIEDGGMLLRFAGSRLAANIDDPLVPVELRAGGRQLSGAMLWSDPAEISEEGLEGPFAGLAIPYDVSVSQQVLAEPSLDLDEKTWMRLEDDTPLVTAERRGDGWLVLIHTTANTKWSNLALSGLFVEMLERLSTLGRGVRDAAGDSGLATPYRMLDGFGRLIEPQNSARPIDVLVLDSLTVSAATPPGYYGTQAVRIAINLSDRVNALAPLASVPADAVVTDFVKAEEQPLTPYLLLAALLLLVLDTLVTTILRGYGLFRLPGATAAVMAALMLVPSAPDAEAQQTSLESDGIPAGALSTTLAYVLTGDAEIDRVSAAGLRGLSAILRQRTSVEPGEPVGVDIENDELAFYPLLYWPIMEGQGSLNAPTADRLNRFMSGGGMILFDTRDGHLANSRFGVSSDALRQLAGHLNIPAVSAVPADHVLTRSFYLMQDFPGRWGGGTVWVEAAESAYTNDGVSPVVVGDANWAAAWAIDDGGRPMFPLGGDADRQREMAYRFGINLVMYTLTGNYKSDQVHIPSILERLGQ